MNAADGTGEPIEWGSLKKGDRVRVLGIDGSDAVAVRLLEMGLVPGTILRFVSTALWGDPLEIERGDYRLSIRKSEAKRVRIERVV